MLLDVHHNIFTGDTATCNIHALSPNFLNPAADTATSCYRLPSRWWEANFAEMIFAHQYHFCTGIKNGLGATPVKGHVDNHMAVYQVKVNNARRRDDIAI